MSRTRGSILQLSANYCGLRPTSSNCQSDIDTLSSRNDVLGTSLWLTVVKFISIFKYISSKQSTSYTLYTYMRIFIHIFLTLHILSLSFVLLPLNAKS